MGNRVIKFRGKRADNGEWAYGELICGVFDGNSFIEGIINSETVGQYTGLKDKKGKEIYEGDIIEKTYYSYHQPECSEIFKIIYNGLGFSFEHIKGRFYHTPFTEEIEVIGNITDNPELLEEKK